MREVRLVTILTCGVLVPPPMVFSLRVAAVTARRAHGAFRFSKRAAAPQRDHVTGELDKVAPHPARHSPERPNEPNQGVRMTPLPAGRCAPDG
jgi:hypothetical protein